MSQCTCAEPQAVAQAIKSSGSEIKDAIGKTLTNQVKESQQNLNETLFGKNQKSQDGSEAQPGKFTRLEMCHWNVPEAGAKGALDWATLFKAAGIAIAIANGIAQSSIEDLQQDLANKYYSQAKYKWNRFRDKYMPLEKKILNETSTTPVRSIDCAGARTRANDAVNSAYHSATSYLQQKAKEYCLCMDPSLLESMNTKQALMLVDSENFNLVDEAWYTDFKNDQRWSRRSNILNLGRNLSSEALSYGQTANKLYSQIGQQINNAANGVMTALGYFGARNDTYIPTAYLNTNVISEGASGVVTQGGHKT